MKEDNLQKTIENHRLWLQDEGQGECADLSFVNLSYVNLSFVDLLRANLFHADLSYADLSHADLSYTDLSHVDLSRANLSHADLSHADLSYADLSHADLSHADLIGANFRCANLSNTVLSPDNTPNGDISEFEPPDEHGLVTGYRTREAGHIDMYRDDRYYSTDVFSTSTTECHPGLYLWPSIIHAKNWSGNREIIAVKTKPSEIHRAGDKWRCRWFYVVGSVTE